MLITIRSAILYAVLIAWLPSAEALTGAGLDSGNSMDLESIRQREIGRVEKIVSEFISSGKGGARANTPKSIEAYRSLNNRLTRIPPEFRSNFNSNELIFEASDSCNALQANCEIQKNMESLNSFKSQLDELGSQMDSLRKSAIAASESGDLERARLIMAEIQVKEAQLDELESKYGETINNSPNLVDPKTMRETITSNHEQAMMAFNQDYAASVGNLNEAIKSGNSSRIQSAIGKFSGLHSEKLLQTKYGPVHQDTLNRELAGYEKLYAKRDQQISSLSPRFREARIVSSSMLNGWNKLLAKLREPVAPTTTGNNILAGQVCTGGGRVWRNDISECSQPETGNTAQNTAQTISQSTAATSFSIPLVSTLAVLPLLALIGGGGT